jgi:hypothetical protein
MPSRPLSHSGQETGNKPLAAECDFHCDLETAVFLRYSTVCLIPAPHRRRHRYLRCRNETDANKTPEREAILAALAEAPRRKAASAVGNRLSPLPPPTSGRRFEVNPPRIALDALFDRIYVIRVSLKLTPQVLPRWLVQDIFRTAKSLLPSAPAFTIRRDQSRPHLLLVPGSDLAREAGGPEGQLTAAGQDFERAISRRISEARFTRCTPCPALRRSRPRHPDDTAVTQGFSPVCSSPQGTKCHVWTTPSKQGRSGMCAAVGCGHVSGLRCAAL